MSTYSQSSENSLLSYLLYGGGWAFGGKVGTALAALAVNALLARLLTPEAMGAYFLTFSLVAISATLATLGLGQTVVRLVAESLGIGKPGRARSAVNFVFRYGALGAFIVAVTLTLGVGRLLAVNVFKSSEITEVVDLAALWVIVITFQRLLSESFRGFHDIRGATIFGGLASNLLCAALFVLIWMLYGYSQLGTVLIVVITAQAASVMLAGSLLRNKVKNLEKDGSLHGREVRQIAWPLLITNLSFFAFTQADLWILGIYRPQEDVAIYGAALRLVMLVVTPLLILNSVVPPLIAQMYGQGKTVELEEVLRTTATLAGIPAFVVLVGLIFGGRTVLELVYGSFYAAGAFALALLSFGQLFNVWAGSCGIALMMTGHHKLMMCITIACGAIKVILAVLLVGNYQLVGVAFAATAGLILQNIAMWLGVRLRTNMWTHVGIVKPLRLKRI